MRDTCLPLRITGINLYLILQAEKHVPMHLRRKQKDKDKAKPRHFEIMPPTGVLMPGQRINVQVKFMPTEEVTDTL